MTYVRSASSRTRIVVVSATIATCASLAAEAARAASVTEYFNGYGTADAQLDANPAPPAAQNAFSGGTGWVSSGTTYGWDVGNPAANAFFRSNTTAASNNLTYSATGYSNAGNTAGSSDGSAGFGTPSTAAGSITVQTRRTFSTALSGTVWGTLLYHRSTSAGEFLFQPNASSDGSSPARHIGVRSGDVLQLRHTTTTTQATGAGTDGQTHLLLMKFTVDPNGNDSMSIWRDPNLSSGESGIGAPTLTSGSGEWFGAGNSFTNVALTFAGGSAANMRVDALRFSDDANAFTQVTLVPEPAGVALVSGCLGAAVVRRRRTA